MSHSWENLYFTARLFLNNKGVYCLNTLWLEMAPIIYNTRAGLADEYCNCLR